MSVFCLEKQLFSLNHELQSGQRSPARIGSTRYNFPEIFRYQFAFNLFTISETKYFSLTERFETNINCWLGDIVELTSS